MPSQSKERDRGMEAAKRKSTHLFGGRRDRKKK